MMLTPGVVGIAVVVAGIVIGVFLVVRWRELRSHNRRFLSSVLAVQVLLLVGIGYTFWPELPSSQTTALSVARLFLGRWSDGHIEEAKHMMAGIKVEEAWPILDDASHAPQSWDLEWFNPRSRVALGRGELATGESVEIAVFIDWDWLNNTWKVTGVQYTTTDQKHPVGIYLIYDNGSYIVFTWGLALAGWASIVIGAWRIRVLWVAWGKRHGQRIITS